MPTAEKILQLLESHPGELLTPQEIMDELAIPLGQKRELRSLLREMVRGGRIVRFRRGTYAAPKGRDTVEGVLQTTRRGDGYVVVKGSTEGDIYIPRKGLGQALDGDWVEALIGSRRGKQPEGRILRVVRHAHERIVGQYLHTGDGGMVLPRNASIGRRIRILRRHSPTQVPEGAWVVAKITHWSESSVEPLIGTVEEVLGTEGDAGIDVLVLIRDMGVVPEFPEEVLAEAAKLPKKISAFEIKKRRDLRALSTFTIDPETAKDFDDALSIENIANDSIRLGVHIADVAHYVQPDTALDKEGYQRATSIYPVDRVVPMLPTVLSNDLCSLRPNEDRLTMSVFVDIDQSGHLSNIEILNSVIHSRFRMSYEEVQAVFDGKPTTRDRELVTIREELVALRDLTKRLTKARMARGALDLDLPETDIIVGPDGRTTAVRPHPRLESHRLVEECMLLANEIVAQYLDKKKLPGLYRVHEEPDADSLDRLRNILYPFGIRFPRGPIRKEDLQTALDQLHDVPGSTILMRFVLRAMKKARYDGKNVGHFGLASEKYCHFTSPIRRYPDLLVHRVIKWSFDSEANKEHLHEAEERLNEFAIHTSEREVNADDIERKATTIKALEFIAPHMGEVYEGRIAGITNFGIFVQLDPWPIEGLIPIRYLDDDYYDFEENAHILKGRRSGRVYRLTDKVKVQIERIDPPAGQMDLLLVQSASKATRKDSRAVRSYSKPRKGKPKRK